MYYVYVLKSKKTDRFYYGYTNDLARRVKQHNNNKGNDWELIYYEAYRAESDARTRERRLKHYSQALSALKYRLKDSLK